MDRTERVVTFSEPEFEQLFVTQYDALVRSLTAITGDAELARDCVQEAFIKAAARWRSIRRYDNPTTWIRRVAINKSRDFHRSERRRLRRESRSAPAEDRSEDRTALIEESMHLTDLLGTLSNRQRSVVALFYVEDLSVAEIAATLGISSGAVKFHLNKARSALRAVVEKDEEEERQRYG